MKILSLLINRKITTSMIFLGISIVGMISFSKIPVELLPDIEIPKLTVITTYENASPSDVEKLVTLKIEEAVTSISGVTGVSSESIEGMSIVRVNFTWGIDMDLALIGVKEKVDFIRGGLPDTCGKSIVIRYNPSDEPVMIYSITLSSGDIRDTRSRVEKEIIPFIERINGVSLVELLGGDKREILVEVDNTLMYSRGVSIAEIVRSISLSNLSYPAGSLIKDDKEYLVRTAGEFRNLDDIRSVVTDINNGRPVYISDIAEVKKGFKDKKSIIRINGEEGVALLIKKEPGKNTIETCSAVQDEMKRFGTGGHHGFNVKCVYDQSLFVRSSIMNVVVSAVLGGFISFFVIWFFLKSLLPPFIISLSIPVSICGTMFLMKLSGISINTMSLGGLALGVGMMVDSGIVVLESIQDYRNSDIHSTPFTAALNGTLNVIAPVSASVLTTVIVFLPVIFLTGLSGALFSDLALTVTFSLILSLVCSITLIPMLSSLNLTTALYNKCSKSRFIKMVFCKMNIVQVTSDFIMNRIDELYQSVIIYALGSKRQILMLGLASVILGLLLIVFVDRELMPSVETGEFLIEIDLPGGMSLAETSNFCKDIENTIIGTGMSEFVYTKAGSDPDESISEKISGDGANHGLIRVFTIDKGSTDSLIKILKERIKFTEGLLLTYRKKDDIVSSIFSNGRNRVNIEICGSEPDRLRRAGDNVKEILSKTGYVHRVSSLFDFEVPELKINIDRTSAATLGLNLEDASIQIGTAIRGEHSSIFRNGDDDTDIRVKLLSSQRNSIASIERINVKTSSGNTIPVSRFAEIKQGAGSGKIVRRERKRINIVTADILPLAGNAVDCLKNLLNNIEPVEDITFTVVDGSDNVRGAFISLGLSMGLAVLFIYMLLAAQFQSFKNPLIIMASLPVTIFGVTLSLLLTGESLNVNSGIGIIILCGTVVNNAIVLFDFINKHCTKGLAVERAIIESGRRRLKPILMTTSTTVLALIPIAAGIGAGSELQRPLAITIIGGMTVSTFLTLIFIPVLYSIVNGKQ